MRREKDIRKYRYLYYRNKIIRVLFLAVLLRNFIKIVQGTDMTYLVVINTIVGIMCLLFDNYVCIMQQDSKKTLVEKEIIAKEQLLYDNIHSLLHIGNK